MKKFILIKCINNIPLNLGVFKTKFKAQIKMKSDFRREIKLLNIDFDDKTKNIKCYGIDSKYGSAWITTPKDKQGCYWSFDWEIIMIDSKKSSNEDYALIKFFERNISLLGVI